MVQPNIGNVERALLEAIRKKKPVGDVIQSVGRPLAAYMTLQDLRKSGIVEYGPDGYKLADGFRIPPTSPEDLPLRGLPGSSDQGAVMYRGRRFPIKR